MLREDFKKFTDKDLIDAFTKGYILQGGRVDLFSKDDIYDFKRSLRFYITDPKQFYAAQLKLYGFNKQYINYNETIEDEANKPENTNRLVNAMGVYYVEKTMNIDLNELKPTHLDDNILFNISMDALKEAIVNCFNNQVSLRTFGISMDIDFDKSSSGKELNRDSNGKYW